MIKERWVLLHGTPLTPAVWDGVVTGCGPQVEVRSPALVPPLTGDPVSTLTEQVLDLVNEGDVPVHLVGHSFGGQLALDVALQRPERVAALTLICARDTPFPPFAAAAERLRAGAPVDVDATLQRWFRPAELAAGGSVIDYARTCVRDADPGRWAVALDAIAGFDRSERSADLTAPVQLIAAGHDQVSTVESMAAMADRIPQARLTVLPDAAHMSMFVDPAALGELLRSTRPG